MAKRWHALVAGLMTVAAAAAVWSPAAAQVPPGYQDVPGSPDAWLRDAQRGAQGTTFKQECSGNPFTPPEGGILWHFVLPQAAYAAAAEPAYIFTKLTVTFRYAGTITTTTFGPPSAMHAWITTPTDDILLDGYADGATKTGAFPRTFNLSHTCASPGATLPSTTTTTSTTVPGPSLGSLLLTKNIGGPLAGQQGPITIEIACTSPNTSIPDWEIPAGATGSPTTVVTGITVPAVCEAREQADGSEGGNVLSVRQVPIGARSSPICSAGQRSVASPGPIELDNYLDTTVPPSTSPGESTTTTGPTTTSGPTTTAGPTTTEVPPVTVTLDPLPPSTVDPPCVTVTLPPTGATDAATGGTALLALGALVVGTGLVLVARRRPSN